MQRNTEENMTSSLGSDGLESPTTSKQSVQLPTIRYPTVAPPLLVDRQRSTYLPGVEYTFTQLQVAQATFRYPPTPPVEVGESSDRLAHTQQSCEAPALSHMSYNANGEAPTSEKNAFPSLPTPPDLVPITEIPPTNSIAHCNVTPQNCSQEANQVYYRKQQWATEDLGQAHCLPSLPHAQQHSSWGTDPMSGGPLLPVQPPTLQQGMKSQMQPTLFFSLPHHASNHPYGEGMFLVVLVLKILAQQFSLHS